MVVTVNCRNITEYVGNKYFTVFTVFAVNTSRKSGLLKSYITLKTHMQMHQIFILTQDRIM